MSPSAPRSHKPVYLAGELIPCLGCHNQVTRVSASTRAYAAVVLLEADAEAGSTVSRCHHCKTLTKVRSESAPFTVGAVAA